LNENTSGTIIEADEDSETETAIIKDDIEESNDQYNCLTVKLIMIKTTVEIKGGLTLVCLHHKFEMTPVMELKLGNLLLNYNMMYDHDTIEGMFDNAEINDLTLWPKT
jgi:hypothetical protein